MTNNVLKTFEDSYLYNLNAEKNQKLLFSFIMQGEQVFPDSDEFEDIKYDIKKRQISNAISKVLISPKTVLMISPTPMPKAFKVFVAKDVKATNPDYKVFIDVSDIIRKVDGVYRCANTDILVSYLFSAMTNFIYTLDPKKILLRTEVVKYGASIYSKLFSHILDVLYKVSSMTMYKDQCLYLAAMYYEVGLLKKDMNNDSVRAVCRSVSKISQRQEEVLMMGVENDDFMNIKYFVELLSEKLKLSKLTVEAVVDKWVWQYGTGTQYALELFPAFANMITNVYIGAYINQQKTIEKVAAGRDIVDFSVALRNIGSECV